MRGRYKWLVLVDDDSFVFVSNLRRCAACTARTPQPRGAAAVAPAGRVRARAIPQAVPQVCPRAHPPVARPGSLLARYCHLEPLYLGDFVFDEWRDARGKKRRGGPSYACGVPLAPRANQK